MATRLGANPEGPFRFKNMIRLGDQILPIDTAVSWTMHPDYVVVFPHRQIYTVIVRLNTLKEGRPSGLLEYCLYADSLEKASGLVATLQRNNVQWNSYLERVDVSRARKTIRLTFSDGAVGKVLDPNGNVSYLNGRDVFLLIRKAAGFRMTDDQVKAVGYNSVDLTFDGEQVVDDMQKTLQKMEKIFPGNVVFKSLAKESGFLIEKASAVASVEQVQKVNSMSLDVWEDEIIGVDRQWKADEVSWHLLSVSKRPEKEEEKL